MFSLIRNTKISISSLKAADNETLTGATLDMQGYDSVAFVAVCLKGNVGDISIKAQQDSASGMGTAADLLGTAVTFSTTAGADALTTLEIHQPQERYVRALVIVPNWDPVSLAVIAIQFNAKDVPITNAGELHVSPAEGTA